MIREMCIYEKAKIAKQCLSVKDTFALHGVYDTHIMIQWNRYLKSLFRTFMKGNSLL